MIGLRKAPKDFAQTRRRPALAVIGGMLTALLAVLTAAVLKIRHEALARIYIQPEVRLGVSETPDDYGITDYEDITLTTVDGIALSGWYIPSHNRAAVIMQHGYSSNRAVMLSMAETLHRNGYGVIMVDFRAHGESAGTMVTFGMEEQHDMDAAYRYLLTRDDVDADRIGALGKSMGAAVLIMYAADNPGIQAVVSHSSYARLDDVIETNIRAYTGLPIFPFAAIAEYFGERATGYTADDGSVIARIGDISPRAVLIIHGGEDENVPGDCGHELYEAAGEPRELWFEPEQGHQHFDIDLPEKFERRVVGFFDRYLLGIE